MSLIKYFLFIFFLSLVACSCTSKKDRPKFSHSELKATSFIKVDFKDKNRVLFTTRLKEEADYNIKIMLFLDKNNKKIIHEENLTSSGEITFELPDDYENYAYISAVIGVEGRSLHAVATYKIGEQEEIDRVKKSLQK